MHWTIILSLLMMKCMVFVGVNSSGLMRGKNYFFFLFLGLLLFKKIIFTTLEEVVLNNIFT